MAITQERMTLLIEAVRHLRTSLNNLEATAKAYLADGRDPATALHIITQLIHDSHLPPKLYEHYVAEMAHFKAVGKTNLAKRRYNQKVKARAFLSAGDHDQPLPNVEELLAKRQAEETPSIVNLRTSEVQYLELIDTFNSMDPLEIPVWEANKGWKWEDRHEYAQKRVTSGAIPPKRFHVSPKEFEQILIKQNALIAARDKPHTPIPTLAPTPSMPAPEDDPNVVGPALMEDQEEIDEAERKKQQAFLASHPQFRGK